MQAKCVLIKSRVLSWLTLIVFSLFSAMPFPGYAATDWEAVVTEEGTLKTRLDDSGNREWMTEGNTRVNVGSFNQGLGETWNFKLGGGDLMVNVNGGERTVWSGTTNVFDGILGLFNLNGIHFTDTSRINLTNAGFIGAAMRAVDGSGFSQLKLQGNGYVLNEGQIRGGDIALLGGAIENRGIIEAPLNQITLAGGKAMTVGLSPDNLISVVVDELTDTKVKNFAGTDLDDQIKNSGNITGHKITLDAKGVDSVFEKAINLTGEIKAVDVDEVDGEIVMMSLDDVYTNAILNAAKIEMNTNGKIENAGTIDAKEFKEHGYTFKNTGTLKGGEVYMDNTDGAADISGTVSSNLSDTGNINLVGHVTLGDNVILTADSDANGTGIITFSDGVSLDGNGKNLTLKASGQSIIRSMDDLNDLTLEGMTAGAQFTLRRGIDMDGDLEVGTNATLDGTFSVTVRGGSVTGVGDINMTGGIFTVLGDGTFGSTQDWNFNQLVFGDGETEATTQKTGANKITIAQDWTIKELHTLRGGSSTWDVTWGDGVMRDIIKISAGTYHSLALSGLDGSVYAWGTSLYVGDGGSSNRLTPVRVKNSDGSYLIGATDIAAGSSHSLALVNGGVKAWGLNSSGRLGDGTTTNQLTAVDVIGLTSGVTAIAVGAYHSLALMNGGVKAWGQNNLGQLGDGTTTDRLTAVDVSGLTSGVTAIAAGTYHSLALINGGVKAWGQNNSGQLGDGTTTNRLTAVDVNGLTSGVTAIVAAVSHSLALVDGGVKAWGLNNLGQLGDGTTTNRLTAVDVSGLTSGVTAIAAGEYHSLALVNGGVKAWGLNSLGRLGDGTATNRSTAVDVTGLTSGVSAIASGNAHSLAIVDGGLKAWGWNSYGQLGDGTTLSRNVAVNPLPVLNLGISKLSNIEKIVSGSFHSLALSSSDGAVYSWGRGNSGQLGDASSSDRYTPVKVKNSDGSYLIGATDIAAGGFHSLALVDGGVKAWGYNVFGQLGDGSSTNRLAAVDVSGLTSGVTAISAGVYHSLAVLNGGVKAWGLNNYGQLGDGSTTTRSTAVDVSGLTSGVTAIAAGEYHSLALMSNGVKAWGRNNYGQLGDGSTTNRLAAVDVSGLTSGVTAIAAGASHSLALVNGGVKAWGLNSSGQLGDGTTTNRLAAVDVSGLTSGVTAIGVGSNHSFALLTDGLKAWGSNGDGQLGDGTTTNRLTTVDVAGLTAGVSAMSAGDAHSLALVNGGVKAWGYNAFGMLGTNGTTNSRTAVDSGTLVFEPFVVDGTFIAENSTVSYSGDVVIGGQQVTTQISDTQFNNLILRNQAQDYVIRGERASEQDFKDITEGKLIIQGEIRKVPVIDTSNVVQVDPTDRMRNIMSVLGGGDRAVVYELLKDLFGGGREMRVQELKTGVNKFEVTPSDLGMDLGLDEFKKMIFDAQVAPLDQRNTLDQSLKTGTVIQNVTGNVRVVASDGKIYDATAGVELQEGDQVITGKSANVELVKGADKVTVSEGSAVQVQKQSEEGKPVQDLLTLAFGQVSIAVAEDSVSSFVVQTPTGISGQRG